jgi:arylsulfatase A-like enzyme
VSAPEDARVEGRNLLPVLTGASPPVERTLFWRNPISGFVQRAARHGDWKLLLDGQSEFLFNVREDPGERQDRATEHPDRVRSLHQQIMAWEADVNAEAAARQ